MGEAFWTLLALHLIVASVLAADLVLRRKEPVATLAWLEGIFLLPVLGALLYLVFGAATAGAQYAVSRDGRFLISQPEASAPTPLTLILNLSGVDGHHR